MPRDYFKQRNGKAMGADHPIAWTNTLNDVRSLNTPLGRQRILEAVKWAARMEAGKP